MTLNPRMIILAREAAGLTQTALAHTVGISQALLSKIEHGFDQPSDELLVRLAAECKVPVEFFFQEDQPIGEGLIDLFHKKRATLPARPLKRANAVVNVTRLEVLRLLRTIELTDVAPFPTFPHDQFDTPDEIARLVRATWRVAAGPLPNLVALVEAAGVPVLLNDLGHEKLSAMCMPGLAGRHLIVLNSQLPASAQRFALAHDLGHLVMHTDSMGNDGEREADHFASALLMPGEDIRPHLRNLRFDGLGRLKPVWRVSLAALIRRAHDLGEITPRQYTTFNIRLNKLPGGRKREPGEFPREEPRLVQHVIEHFRSELGYTASDVARLMVSEEEVVRERYYGEQPRTLRPVGSDGRHLHRLRLPHDS